MILSALKGIKAILVFLIDLATRYNGYRYRIQNHKKVNAVETHDRTIRAARNQLTVTRAKADKVQKALDKQLSELSSI